jgi:type VI secretion system protein ImpG
LGGDYAEASDLYLLLNRHVREIVIKPKEGGEPLTLPPHFLRPCGFSKEEELIPYPSQSFPGYRVIHEYFLLPQKFLFMDLSGLERWSERGAGAEFDIIFALSDLPFDPPKIKKEHFVLYASPIINIFEHGADPIILDHRQSEYALRPAGANSSHYEVYSVDSVIGLVRGSVERKEYSALDLFRSPGEGCPVYQVVRKPSPLDQSARVFLSLPYSGASSSVVEETLSVNLSCTNAALPERLQLGDISQATSTSPELLVFKNIVPVTVSGQPPLGSNAIWRFLSHLSLNYLSLADAQNLKELLRLYIFPESRDKPKIAANEKRVESIEEIRVSPADRLVSGHMMRGQSIQLKLRQDHFASTGDMFLFCSILDYFLGVFASMNCFTQLNALDLIKGKTYLWPPRIGDSPLL